MYTYFILVYMRVYCISKEYWHKFKFTGICVYLKIKECCLPIDLSKEFLEPQNRDSEKIKWYSKIYYFFSLYYLSCPNFLNKHTFALFDLQWIKLIICTYIGSEEWFERPIWEKYGFKTNWRVDCARAFCWENKRWS